MDPIRPVSPLLVTASLLFAATTSFANAKPISYVCTFADAKMTLTFVLDSAVLTQRAIAAATLIGNNGTSELLAFPGPAGVSFVEVLETGAVQTTTIQTSSL